jgi:D-sedoheptulose 7-phosphate isomerase
MNTHVEALTRALRTFSDQVGTVHRWGEHLAAQLGSGGRLLATGNGGSAAQAQHLTAELVGRYRDDRRPLSALALHAETSSTTAIVNDYGAEEMFARQVQAHGRPGDVLLLLSTSGNSPNLVSAAARGREGGLTVWAMTGRRPNALASLADDALCVEATETATVQEVHLVAVHLICEALDASLGIPAPLTEVPA